jgi:hypothetical protein
MDEMVTVVEQQNQPIRRFDGLNLLMTKGLLKTVPLGEILAALSNHELQLERPENHRQPLFITKHLTPEPIEFQITTDRERELTSLHLENEDPGF